MKRLLVLALCLAGCAHVRPLEEPHIPKPVVMNLDERFPPELNLVPVIAGATTGSACPTEIGLLTAAHLAKGLIYVYGVDGSKSPVSIVNRDEGRDIAKLSGWQLHQPFPVAQSLPPIGAHVWARGMLSDGVLTVLEGNYMGIDDGWIRIDGIGTPGMSGSCLFFREAGRLVVAGIVVAIQSQRLVGDSGFVFDARSSNLAYSIVGGLPFFAEPRHWQ